MLIAFGIAGGVAAGYALRYYLGPKIDAETGIVVHKGIQYVRQLPNMVRSHL